MAPFSIAYLVGAGGGVSQVQLGSELWSVRADKSVGTWSGWERLLWSDPEGTLELYVVGSDADQFVFKFPELACVVVSLSKRAVAYAVQGDLAKETLKHLLADQVFPRIMARGAGVVLHAGGVQISHHAALFLAPSGSGKSTLTASLHHAGHPLLGDDAIVVTDGEPRPHARATYPSLRLLPDSISALYADRPEASLVAHYSDKQRVLLPLGADDLAAPVAALPVGAVFFLSGEGEPGQITLTTVTDAEACMGLIENSFQFDPSDVAATHRKLVEASRIVAKVPCYRLAYPRDYAMLPQVRAAIVEAVTASEG